MDETQIISAKIYESDSKDIYKNTQIIGKCKNRAECGGSHR